jgi:hypothetical protein
VRAERTGPPAEHREADPYSSGRRSSAGRAIDDLPIGEALHPVALAAVIVLLVNDWWLKPSDTPRWLTGKLSDLAGLVFAPLVATALCDTVLWIAARLGAAVEPALDRKKLAGAIALVGGVFAAVKLSPAAAEAVARVWSWSGVDATIYPDPTDLLALPALAVAWWIGAREIRSTTAPRAAPAGRP